MSGGEAVEVIGAERCAATLDVASRKLGDLADPATKASVVIAGAARVRAPRATGTLQASIRAAAEGSTARVEVGVRYGWPVHSGVPAPHPGHEVARPFLADAADATQPIWSGFYEGKVEDVMGTVKGA